MADLDPVRAAALANAVELTRSDVPIGEETVHETTAVTLIIADMMLAWLQGDAPELGEGP